MAETATVIYHAKDASWKADAGADCLVLLRPGQITAMVFDAAQFKYVWLKTVAATELNTTDIEAALPDFECKNLNFFVGGINATLVPQPLYDEKEVKNFFTLNHKLENDEILQADFLKRLQAYLIYTVPQKWFGQLKNDYPNARFYHEDGAWLEVLIRHYKNLKGTFLHIDFRKDFITVAAVRDGRLLLYNNYTTQTVEDRLYFTMFVAEQLQINPQQDVFFLSGEISKTDENWELFGKYIKNIKLFTRPEPFRFALPLQQELPEPLYTKAFCTAVCVL